MCARACVCTLCVCTHAHTPCVCVCMYTRARAHTHTLRLRACFPPYHRPHSPRRDALHVLSAPAPAPRARGRSSSDSRLPRKGHPASSPVGPVPHPQSAPLARARHLPSPSPAQRAGAPPPRHALARRTDACARPSTQRSSGKGAAGRAEWSGCG